MTEVEIGEALKKLFTTGNFIIIPSQDFEEMLPSLKVAIDIEKIASYLKLILSDSSDTLENHFKTYIDENSLLEPIVIDLNNEFQLYFPPEKSKVIPKIENALHDENSKDSLVKNIEICEDILIKQKANWEDTKHTEEYLVNLKKQLAGSKEQIIQEKIFNSSILSTLTMNSRDKRLKALHEIFYFYTKQLALAHIRKTFDAVQKEMDTMTLGYYIRFLKDFKVAFELKVNMKLIDRN